MVDQNPSRSRILDEKQSHVSFHISQAYVRYKYHAYTYS